MQRTLWQTGKRTACAAVVAGASPLAVLAQADLTPTLYGTPGLIEMPSALDFDDADLKTTFAGFSGQFRNTLTFQVTPRLAGSFRYSRISGFQPGDRTLYDRSFDISYQILTETASRPALSIGLRDIVGTGIYSGEYIVATKSLGDNLRVTGGLGWGRLGSDGGIGAPFGSRPPLDYGLGGRLTDDQWFRGDVAPFGGIEWAVNDQLSVSAEVSSDAYSAEEARGLIDRKSPVNLGVSYRFDSGATVSGYWLHGSEVGVGVSFTANPKVTKTPTGSEAGPLPVRVRPSRAAAPQDWSEDWVSDTSGIGTLRGAIAESLAKDGIVLEGMTLDARLARVSIRNTRFAAHPQALGRTVRVLSRALLASIARFEVTLSTASGLPSSTVALARRDIERLEFSDATEVLAVADVVDAADAAGSDTVLPPTWSLEPYTAFSLFDPDSPVRAELGLRLRGDAELSRGLLLSASVKKVLLGNLDEIDRSVTTGLEPVRSNVSVYNTEGDPALESLTLTHYARPASNLYSRVTAGYLETMFGGVSGEVLWKPVDSRFAIGAEMNWVQQRDFDQGFGFQDYNTLTGHLSTYFAFGDGFLGQLDIGQYLAGDVGATLSLSREFGNGWLVGAYVTRTNATFEDFGEGSFDKGIRLVIPTEWTRGAPSRNRREVDLRSLSRDGGARVKVDGRLYDLVRGAHRRGLEQSWGRFWR